MRTDSLTAEPPGKPKNTGVGSPQEKNRGLLLQADSLPTELSEKPYHIHINDKILTELTLLFYLFKVNSHRKLPGQKDHPIFTFSSDGFLGMHM